MKTHIYFIALIPGEEICEEVTEFKKYAARHFDSAHALKSPPHITLISPFRWNTDEEASLKTVLHAFASGQPAFSILLSHFDHFGKRVIFVNIEDNDELSKLQEKLSLELQQKLELPCDDKRPFHPHMTVAFKDLQVKVFPQAWDHFRQIEYERAFEANKIYLLRHDSQKWQTIAWFNMQLKS